ncbi:hypothetical protein AND_002252 [Anopheles darlingi]|uniref:Uncharacterized protein n=1 Tax=Anopheles darlingi TaxID=43151 RepID=W5JPB1_ANODA|nr:hypothetical protein AND_002252 [Anopheles darlingi]
MAPYDIAPGLVVYILGVSNTCNGQCEESDSFVCTIGLINMTSDGGPRLRRAIDSAERLWSIEIERLIVSSTASGPFLQRIGAFTKSLAFEQYHDAVFQLPPDTIIEQLVISNASPLRSFVAAKNDYLTSLDIEKCSLDRIPTTLANMPMLYRLSITECALTVVRMDAFAGTSALESVALNGNKIRQLLPATSNTPLPIRDFSIEGNLLERVDMAVFASMQELLQLRLRSNRIIAVQATLPATLPNLFQLRLELNDISSIELGQLTLPNLAVLMLDQNAFVDIPTNWPKMPELQTLSISNNNLKEANLTSLRVDMAVFAPMPELEVLSLKNNRIIALHATLPLTLANLIHLQLEVNDISSIELGQLTLPKLEGLRLDLNALQDIPTNWPKMPELQSLSIMQNKLKEANVTSLRVFPNLQNIYLDVKLTGLVVYVLSMSPNCNGQCEEYGLFSCSIGLINMTSDGGPRLRRAIDNVEDTLWYIYINRLIVSSSASGPFLQRIGAFTRSLSFLKYHDAVFQLPADTVIEDIFISEALPLRSFVAAKNQYFKSLFIEKCSLDRIPTTLANMPVLNILIIKECALTVVRMDAFAGNSALETVELDANKIRQLLPATSNTPLSIRDFSIEENLLERVDMAVFASMPELELLSLRNNRIIALQATLPLTLANLSRFHLGMNDISSIELGQLTLSKLGMLILDVNPLSEIPTNWPKMPDLRMLSIEETNLKEANLTSLRVFSKLHSLYLGSNQITTFQVREPVRLPALEVFSLAKNKLTSVNFGKLDLPVIYSIQLDYNQLKAIPPLFQRYPNLKMLSQPRARGGGGGSGIMSLNPTADF